MFGNNNYNFINFIFVLLLKFTLCFADPLFHHGGGARIVGGTNATIEEIPWQVAIHYYQVNHCGGSIINSDTILTAAHCFYVTGADPEAYKIRAGTDRRSVGGQMFKVKQILVHPEFNITTYNYDIAIMKLETTIDYNEKMQPIELADSNEMLPVGEFGLVSGFGKLGTDLYFPKILQMVFLEVLDQNICKAKYEGVNVIQDTMFCAGGDGIKDSCRGDSGGPFVINGKLFGITSYGIECALPEYPGVFTRISTFRKWIDNIINI